MRISLSIILLLVGGSSAGLLPHSVVWETSGFDNFRQGEFEASGYNLYVSKKGLVQTIHRNDVNQDGFFDLFFGDTHDRTHIVPAFQYHLKAESRTDFVRVDYPGVGSFRIIATDVNNDKLPELIIGRGDDNVTPNLNTYIYWGTPSGWSERFHTELLTPTLRDLCVGDVNNDGKIDIIAVSGANLLTYLGQSNGFTYQDRISYPVTSLNQCRVADVDGDSLNDLLLTGTNNSNKIVWGVANAIGFDNTTKLPVDTAIGASLIGSQLVLTTPAGPKLYSIKNRQLSLEETIDYPESGRFDAADLDGDHVPDLVVSRMSLEGNYETTSRVFFGKNSGSKVTYLHARVLNLPTLGANDVVISDIDSDGIKDIVFANSRDNDSYSVPSYIYWGNIEGYSQKHRTGLLTHGVQSVSTSGSDVFFANNVIARRRGDVDSLIYLGTKQGQYSTDHLIRLPTVGGYEGCLSDLNDDGHVDALVANSYEDAPDLKGGSYIFWGGKSGLSAASRSIVPSRGGIGCVVADVNVDGYLDLLIANLSGDSVSLFLGGLDDDYGKREQVLKVKDPRFPSIADLNKDGFLDLVIPSVKEGLVIFWGGPRGYSQDGHTILPGIAPVAQQIADLNGDGYLDIVLCNIFDEANRLFHGINSYIYWGSSDGYSPMRRMDIPSMGGTYATIADFNRDKHLDIFVSNYQSEFERSLDSYIYWGNPSATYNDKARTNLHVGSASGAVSADLNNDGWIDIAVANHYENGTHLTNSYVFWNGPDGFTNNRKTSLPTIGPHMMTGVDPGSIYTRELGEAYTSKAYDAVSNVAPQGLQWSGSTPFDTKLGFEIRGSNSLQGLQNAPWQSLGTQTENDRGTSLPPTPPNRWWQYRVKFFESYASSPTLNRVSITFQ